MTMFPHSGHTIKVEENFLILYNVLSLLIVIGLQWHWDSDG
jgi:hypothetical protein